MTTTIQKWGNSQGIRIPKFILDDVKWSENEEITLTVKEGRIIMEKKHERKNIKELFKGYKGEYKREDIDWGETVGDEVW